MIGGCVLHRWPLFCFAFSSISILAFYLMYLTWNGRHGMAWYGMTRKQATRFIRLFYSICHSSFLSYFSFSFKSHSPTLLVPKHTYKIGLTNVLEHTAMECSSTMEIITEQTHLMHKHSISSLPTITMDELNSEHFSLSLQSTVQHSDTNTE